MTEIRIPYRSRDDTLPAVADAARALTGDDRTVVRQIVLDAAASGLATAGDLLDRLQAGSPAERRALLDRARSSAGLPTASALAAKASHEAQSRAMFVAAADDVELQLVPGPSGWIDPDAQALEAAQARAEAERRAAELAQRRAAREAQLPALEIEDAAEREAWIGANVMRPQEIE